MGIPKTNMPPGGDVGGADLPKARTDTGFGATAADVKRGYTEPLPKRDGDALPMDEFIGFGFD